MPVIRLPRLVNPSPRRPAGACRGGKRKATGAAALEDNCEAVRASDAVVLAIKPQQMHDVLGEIRPEVIAAEPLLISIAAGVTIDTIVGRLDIHGCGVVRVMPNTPCLVGASASAYAAGSDANEDDVKLVDRLFNAVGRAFAVPEKLLDAVTGLSGSGPAFVALVIEALSDGGVKMGLPRDLATQLAAQTVLGSAKLLL